AGVAISQPRSTKKPRPRRLLYDFSGAGGVCAGFLPGFLPNRKRKIRTDFFSTYHANAASRKIVTTHSTITGTFTISQIRKSPKLPSDSTRSATADLALAPGLPPVAGASEVSLTVICDISI